MFDANKVNDAIDALIRDFQELKIALGSPSNSTPTSTLNEDLDTFEKLKKALESERWVEAVNPNLVIDLNSDFDKVERGRGIIELMIEENLKGLNFLDFGCGEGFSTNYAAEIGANIAVGYDVANKKWDNFVSKDNMAFTTSFDDVVNKGPYDVVIAYDVIDHPINEHPLDLVKKMASVLKPDGKIYLRTHPFTSRHATHLYYDLNKSYLHLVFREDELKQLVPASKEQLNNFGVIYPLKTYKGYFGEAGLKVLNERMIKDQVEPFFKIPKVAERIMERLKVNQFPEFQLSIQFIDFCLTKA
jgi:2-polyprenyl-3-methyl-5-hydroxy-6-metoxy-1,4-benzoquinol methylase